MVSIKREVEQLAMKLLARREHSRWQLTEKLTQRGFKTADIEPMLGQLEAQDLLSDVRFAECYLRYRKCSGFGPLGISAELRRAGVASWQVTRCLQVVSEAQWQQQLAQLYCARFGSHKPQTYNVAVKRMRFLQQRGFRAEQIKLYCKTWDVELDLE